METPTTASPSWLDKEFFETLLRENEENPSITVQDVTVELAVGKGENYMSQLHRVRAHFTKDGKSEHRSLIVKTLPSAEFLAKMVTESGFFRKELRMYEVTLPALYDLETSSTPFSTRFYRTTRPNTLVMDDLVQQGFKMAVRHRGLNLEQTKMALNAFARLHALSLALKARDPDSMNQFGEPFHNEENREKNKQFFLPLINMLASNVEKWEGFERFGEKLREIDWVEVGIQMATVKEGDIAVLNHGDGWINNMLFQEDDLGKVTNFKFVDFQVCRFASPGLDLQYFLSTSPNEDTRENHWDELIEHYYETFVKVLKSVGCESKAFSYDKLKQEVKDKMPFGLMTTCIFLPIVLVDPEDAPDMVDFTEDNVEQQMEASNVGKSMNSKLFKKVFSKSLLKFESMGLL